MGLTPDDIAHRAFTPSADGYHQGEVRSFLERVAAQLRGLQSAMPEGRAELAELTGALHDHEPRLTQIQTQLGTMLEALTVATNQLQTAQAETVNHLAVAKQLAADQAAAASVVTAQRDVATELAAEQRVVLDGLRGDRQAITAQLQMAQQLAHGERGAPQPAAATATTQSAIAEAADASEEQAALASTTSATPLPVTTPSSATPLSAPTGDPLLLFGSDLDDQPLFSDNANDLLDGVLDDVMENLTDEGNPS